MMPETGHLPPTAATMAARSRMRAIFFLSAASFAAAGTTRVMDTILPQVAQEFDVTIGAAGFVATAYAFTYGVFQMVFGPLGDRFGKFPIILLACVGSALATFACASADSLWGIAGARLLSGMTAAAIVPLAIAWVGDVVTGPERQPVLARFLSGQILGLLAGQIGGGVLGEHFGWRSAFVLIGAVYLFAVVGLIREMVLNPDTRSGGSRHGGGWFGTWNTFLRLAGRPVVRFVLLAVSIEAFAMFGAFTYLGADLRLRFGFDFATVGLYLAAYCVGGLLYVLQSRWLIARFGPAGLAFRGTVLTAVSYLAIAFTPVAWICIPAIAVMGLGFYMLHNTLQTCATQMAPDARGSAVALFATFYFVAQAIGVYLAGQAIDLYGTAPVFVLAALLLVALGFLLLLRLPEELSAG